MPSQVCFGEHDHPKIRDADISHTLSVGRSSVSQTCAESTFIQEREELDFSAATLAEMSAQYLQMSYIFIQLTHCNCYQGNISPSDNTQTYLGSPQQE